jgi:hypothetical protein
MAELGRRDNKKYKPWKASVLWPKVILNYAVNFTNSQEIFLVGGFR